MEPSIHIITDSFPPQTSRKSAWDDFVLSQETPHLEQISAWGELRASEGWTPHWALVEERGRVVAGALTLERAIAPGLRVGYVCRGPLVSAECKPETAVEALRSVAHALRLTYLALSPPYFTDALEAPLRRANFTARPPALPPAVGSRATLVIDLARDSAAIFAGIRRSIRNEIYRSNRLGTRVRSGTRADLRVFVNQVDQLCRRRGVRSNMPGGGFVEQLWERLLPRGLVDLHIAECEGAPVASMLVLYSGTWARAWRMGWTGTHADRFPTQALYWHAIIAAKERGCHHFDVMGVDYDDARALVAGRPSSSPFKCSMTFFKVGFGGRIILLPAERCYFPNRALALAWRLGGRRLLASTLGTRVLNRVHTAAVPRNT